MRKQVDVLFLYEHVAREVDIACVAIQLLRTKHGVSAEIAPLFENLWETIQSYEPKLIVVPFLRSGTDNAIYDLRHHYAGTPILSLDYEQILSATNKDYFAPRDEFARNVGYRVSWSPSHVELLKSWGVPADHILLTGNPNFAFFEPPYAGSIPSREELAKRYGLTSRRRWVFMPLNYGWAMMTEAEVEARIQRGYAADKAWEYRRFLTESLEAVCKWWLKAAKEFDVELIVRERPAIPNSTTVEFLKKRWGEVPSNVHIIKDLRVTDWAPSVDLAFTSFSTSVFQTLYVKKPSWLMEPYPFPEFFLCDVNEIVPALRSEGAFLEAVGQGGTWSEQMEAARKQLFARWLPVGDPMQALAGAVANLAQKQGRVPDVSARAVSDTMAYKFNRLATKVKAVVNPASKNMTGGQDRNELDRLSRLELSNRLERWANQLGVMP